MQKLASLTLAAIFAFIATPIHALDLSPLVGTVQIQFQPVQSQGEKEGCALIYRVIGQDYAYRRGGLVSLVGNITIWSKRQRLILALKIRVSDSLDSNGTPVLPFFAYVQTPHGTTAKSKVGEGSELGNRIFVYEFTEDVAKVLMDILDREPVTIGFNQHKGGLDVMVPLDLRVADASVSADGSIVRHQSDEMLHHFAECSNEVIQQVRQQIELQTEWENAEPVQPSDLHKKTTPSNRNSLK